MSYRGLLGQSAIEYLMTYGWMLLVVAIAGGTIFSVAQQESGDSVSGFSGSDVLIDDFGVSSDDELGLSTRNGAGNEIVVSRVNVSDPESGEWVYKEFTGDNEIGVGSEKIFELPNVTRGDGSNILDVEIVYDSGGLSNLSVSGTVSGDLELTDSGSYQGLPEDDHQPINNGGDGGGGAAEQFTVSYDPNGSTPYNIDVSGNDTIEVELEGAAGEDDNEVGGIGGYINTNISVSGLNEINLYVSQGRMSRNSGSDSAAGNGGGTTVITDLQDNIIAVADGAGGGGCTGGGCGATENGGARGGSGYLEFAEGIGFGGEGGGLDKVGFNGAGEVNPDYVTGISSSSTGYPDGANSSKIGDGDRPSDYDPNDPDNVPTALSDESFDPDQHVIGVGHGSTVHNGSAEITFNVGQ